MEPESCTEHKLSFCFTFLCDPDLGQRTLILIMTYHLIIVYLFIQSVKLASVVSYAPEGTSGGILKSHRPSVRLSVTNRVSAITHKLLKQI